MVGPSRLEPEASGVSRVHRVERFGAWPIVGLARLLVRPLAFLSNLSAARNIDASPEDDSADSQTVNGPLG
jgi:hypothetical protein